MKKLLLGLWAILPFACSSYAQNVVTVQSAGTDIDGLAPSISLAFSGNTTTGNTIIVALDTGGTITQVSDTQGNPYVKDLGPIGGTSYLFRASNIAGGPDTVNATFSGQAYASIHIVEYSGLATSSPLDGASGANGHAAAVNCANVTTSNQNDLLVVYARLKFTLASADPNYAPTDTLWNWMGDRRVSRTGSYTASFTQEPGGTYECLLAAYKAGSGGSGGSSLQIDTATVPNGTVNLPYTTTLVASGGKAPYTWSVASGSLPPGLTLAASTGGIAGAPTETGSYTFTVRVRDSSTPRQRATKALVLTVGGSGSPLQITTNAMLGGVVGVPYGATLSAANGRPPYAWSSGSGQLPPGLVLDGSSGVISGTPSQSGAFTFQVTVRDSSAQTASASLGINIGPGGDGGPPRDELFSDGFESGDFSKWTYVAGVSGSVTINSDPAFVHSGGKSARFFYDIDAGGDEHQDEGAYVEKWYSPGLSEFYIRGWVYFKSPEPGGSKDIQSGRKLFYLKSENLVGGGAASAWSCHLTSDSPGNDPNRINPRVECNTFDQTVSFTYYSTGDFPFDEWHAVELHLKANTPGQRDGLFEIWLDGHRILNQGGLNIRGSNTDGIKYIAVGMQADRTAHRAVREYRYWDDIVISTSGPIGP